MNSRSYPVEMSSDTNPSSSHPRWIRLLFILCLDSLCYQCWDSSHFSLSLSSCRPVCSSRMGCQIRLQEDMDGMTFGLPPYLDKTISWAIDDFYDEDISRIQPPSLRVSSSGREMDDGSFDAVDGVSRKMFQRTEFPDPGKLL